MSLYYGDLIKTTGGSLGVVRDISHGEFAIYIIPMNKNLMLPTEKAAWWKENELTLIERGPAFKYTLSEKQISETQGFVMEEYLLKHTGQYYKKELLKHLKPWSEIKGETYPARVVNLKAEIPKKPGYYWWKEDRESKLEIARVDEDGEVYFIGNEVPLSIGIGTYWSDIGLFGHEVVGPHTITETQGGS